MIFIKVLIISCLIGIGTLVSAQDHASYIRQFQDLAVAEMLRTRIPASIKLAQAILESRCGRSDLACKANNHFGIKCGSDWRGKGYHLEDDDYSNGKLIKSCFREFNSVMESYMAHSDFLSDPGKASRYGFLFQLNLTDYKGWAKGLSRAGYATDPQYANKLIDIIEKYELFRFDNEYERQMAAIASRPTMIDMIVRYNNDVSYAVAASGDNAYIFAQRHDMRVSQLMKYNDDILSQEQLLDAGSKVYLQNKKSKYHGRQNYHLLKPGETMVAVSQQYGIKLDALLKRNGIINNEIPLPNQKIMLKGKLKKALRTADPYQVPEEKRTPVQQPMNAKVVSADVVDGQIVHGSASVNKTRPDLHAIRNENDHISHTVAKGETLYGIARTYGLSVDDLKKRNNLSADLIYTGQKLTLK
jgi:LysM repeat protein